MELELFERTFGSGGPVLHVAAPGRVNLIGEHVDYHGLPVFPIALQRRVRVAFRPRGDARIRAASAGYGTREFEWEPELRPGPSGDWENYVKAAAQAVARKWGVRRGMDAAIASDLPPAAGLSSSSALIVALTLALLRANEQPATFEELMEVLPEGEYFVGTRGGGMDHAASLASCAGHASLIEFEPLSVHHVRVPEDWAFLVAHSLTTAEKSGSAREEFNARRAAGTQALVRLGLHSYREALQRTGIGPLRGLSELELASYTHVMSEAVRVREAVRAMEAGDAAKFGILLQHSHASLRDNLRVSCPALDRLVEAAMESGALGARLTGAGFGGCAVVFCRRPDVPAVTAGLIERFYAGRPEFRANDHLIDAEPGAGALHDWD